MVRARSDDRKDAAAAKLRSAGRKPALPRQARAADSVERVYAVLKAFAAEYRFRPGQKINEAELAAELKVSRTPVRAALNRLERDGFVVIVPNKGFYARELTPDSVRELYELRAALERAAFALACTRASDAEIEATVAKWEAHNSLDVEGSWDNVALADEAFHMALTRLAKNSQMVVALESLGARIRFFRRIALEALPQRAQGYREHAAIIDALRRRDAAGGAELVERHVTLSADHAIEVATRGLARIFFGDAA
ncbi:GntR family transcriptional regulator [Ancylobacter sp. 6x-1]|uniref:GntR family transcriptional regulator n=1 Tax=Ancylobacter crimeensis TaxID=2579147 RepID=A0ABT0DGN5_9HYPH|nr:GntR family transcriptional regulator [Ancylobacter crimeensis]MCK0198917.1 GntR family transcriptional regulator [Ancylobacter crimeensis]